MTVLFKRILADERGGSAIEYGLLAAILGMGLVASLEMLQGAFATLFGSIESNIPD